MSYREFFKRLTTRCPYPYQERLAEALLNGQSVILRAPTGAGKTWAVTAPFLYRLAQGEPLADRLFYALPLRSLATSLHREVLGRMRALRPELGSVEESAQDRPYPSDSRYCSLQIGGERNDPFFQGDLIFTTIDQLLSSYLLHPVALPPKLDNLNAGALIGSLMVFDEAHLLDARTALGTTIEMLHRLHREHRLCQFVLMTATMSDGAIRTLAATLKATPFLLEDGEARAIQGERRRLWRWHNEPLTAAKALDEYRGGRAIVMVNTVDRAQGLYREFRDAWPLESRSRPELILLHARFFPEDRKAKEDRLASLFGPEAEGAPDVILIATQVIEAGMDISAELLLSELAPMNALIQRAGRSARYRTEGRNEGQVVVFELERDEKGQRRLGPYRGDQDVIQKTAKTLESQPQGGLPVTDREERDWIERAHQAEEQSVLKHYQALGDKHGRRREVHDSMQEGGRGRLSSLVRDVRSVGVVLTSQPEQIALGRGQWPRLLGIDPNTLKGKLRWALADATEGQWLAKGLTEVFPDESRVTSYGWKEIESPEAVSPYWLIALHPHFAAYDSEVGLQLGVAGEETPLQQGDAAPRLRYSYCFETWADHTRAVVEQGRRMRRAYRTGAARIAVICGVTEQGVEGWVALAGAIHDIGKLQDEWQQAAWSWQQDRDARRGLPAREWVAIAHTDFDPLTDWDLRRGAPYRRPNHAVESAWAASQALARRFAKELPEDASDGLRRAVFAAVAHHHSPRAMTIPRFRLHAWARDIVAQTAPAEWRDLELVDFVESAKVLERCFERRWFHLDLEAGGSIRWPLYCFLVRRLRLADQEATRLGSEMSLRH